MYEESVIVVEAQNSATAAKKALRAAKRYATDGTEFCGLVGVYPILEDELSDGVEVFAAFRLSTLAPRDFVNRFYFGRSSLAAGLAG